MIIFASNTATTTVTIRQVPGGFLVSSTDGVINRVIESLREAVKYFSEALKEVENVQ